MFLVLNRKTIVNLLIVGFSCYVTVKVLIVLDEPELMKLEQAPSGEMLEISGEMLDLDIDIKHLYQDVKQDEPDN